MQKDHRTTHPIPPVSRMLSFIKSNQMTSLINETS